MFAPLTFQAVVQRLQDHFPLLPLQPLQEPGPMPQLLVQAHHLVPICLFLKTEPGLYFDMLHCVTGIDLGPEADAMQIAYNLQSVLCNHSLCLLVQLPRQQAQVPSLSTVWAAADWLERETFDLLGITFLGHPDPRRLLLPADWQGHPLRKDYVVQQYYHGLPVPHPDAKP